MTEAHWSEIEKVLLYVADARARAAKARSQLERDDAPPHAQNAMGTAEQELADLHRRLKQETYYAVDGATTTLAV